MIVKDTTDWKSDIAKKAVFHIKMTRKWHKYTYIYFFPAGIEYVY